MKKSYFIFNDLAYYELSYITDENSFVIIKPNLKQKLDIRN